MIKAILFSLLFSAAMAAETKWSFPNKDKEEEQKKMPATLNSILYKRAKQTDKMELPGQKVVTSDAPTTFSAELPSGMTYSSFSSSSSSHLVDGKWVTETTSTEIKPDANNRLRGVTKRDRIVEAATDNLSPFASISSSSSSASSVSSASSSSSTSSSMSSSPSSPFEEPEEDIFSSSPINAIQSISTMQNSFFNGGPAGGLLFSSPLRLSTFRQPQIADIEEERKK